MSRYLKAAAAAVAVAGGLGSVGCQSNGNGRASFDDRTAGYYDPCWPERYNYVARAEVLSPFAIHAVNGEIIDSTLFAYHFETGSDRLNPAGAEKIDYLVRKRPAPPARLYVQTARDLAYDAAAPDKMVGSRDDLNARRAAAVQRYVAASTAGRATPVTVEVQVIDPADMSFRAEGPANAVRGWPARFQSGVEGVSSNNLSGAGGGAAPGTPAPGTAGATGGTPR